MGSLQPQNALPATSLSRCLLPALSFQLLDASRDRWPAEEIVSHSSHVIASVWLSIVLKDGSFDIVGEWRAEPLARHKSTPLVRSCYRNYSGALRRRIWRAGQGQANRMTRCVPSSCHLPKVQGGDEGWICA